MADPNDGWETITDPGDVPADIRKSLGVAGVRTALGLTTGTGGSGKAVPAWAKKDFEAQRDPYAALDRAVKGFKSEYAGNTITGRLENSIQGKWSGFGSKGQRDYWAAVDAADNEIRNKLFGASLTAGEQAAYERTTVDPSLDPEIVRQNLERRRDIVKGAVQRNYKFLKAQGYNAEAIEALAGEYAPDLDPEIGAQRAAAKGGDQTSGTAGAVGGSSAPPAGPTGPDSRGDVTFNDEGPQLAAGVSRLSPEDAEKLYQFSLTKPSAAGLKLFYDQLGGGTLPEANAQAIADYYAKGGKERIGINYKNAEVTPVDPGDGTAGAVARGITSNVPFSREIAAGIETIADGDSTYRENLEEEYGKRAFVEQNNGTAYTLGGIVGALPLGGVEFAGGRAAALAAGRAAVRGGASAAEARIIANRVLAQRTAVDAAAQSGIYGVGNADGSFTDRLGVGAVSAATGAAGGYALTRGGGRFARALAARKSAAARAYNPSTEASEVARLADEQGIRLLPQDVADGPAVGRMTAGAAQTVFGGNTIRQATDNLYNDFSQRVRAVGGAPGTADEVGTALKQSSAATATREATRAQVATEAVQANLANPVDVTGAGQIAQRGATRWMEESAERANQLYARVPIAQDAPAALGNTRAALADLNAGMQSNQQLGAMFANPRLNAYARALTDDIDENTGEVVREGGLSWRDLQEFRTRIGDALDDPRLSEKIAPRQLRALYGALSEDMRATAAQEGPDALRAWRRANDFYDGRMKRINDTLSSVLGERRDRTPNEAISSLQSMLREGSTGDAARFSRVMRSMAPEDAATVRSTIVNEARGGREFDAARLAQEWPKLSERGKSALLPSAGMRQIMDDAADRAAASTRDPLGKRSAEQIIGDFERMAGNRGDSVAFRRQMAALSPEEANSVRSLLINRMGKVRDDATGGEVFSIARFLTGWDKMTPESKLTLFGSGEMRSNMDALARIAEKVKGSEALRGHSNSGAILSVNTASGGLAAAAVALLTGHPIVALGLAAPAIEQRVRAEVLTSRRLLNWLAKAPKKPNVQAQRAHIKSLSSIARAEPAIATDVLALQQRLVDAFGGTPARLAANKRDDHAPIADRQKGNGATANQRLQP